VQLLPFPVQRLTTGSSTNPACFPRRAIETNRDKIENVDVDQSLLGRIFGDGTVVVRGTGGSLEPICNIGDLLTFRTYTGFRVSPDVVE